MGHRAPLAGGEQPPYQAPTLASTTTIQNNPPNWYGRCAVEVVNGVVVLVYIRQSAHNVADGEIHIRFSADYGDNWSDEDKHLDGSAVTNFPMNPPDSAGEPLEPWLIKAPNGDVLLHMWKGTAHGLYQSRGTNSGHDWTAPELVAFSGTTDDLLIRTTEDYFVLDGVIYSGARRYPESAESEKCIIVTSDDNGESWAYLADVTQPENDTNEFSLCYLGDGNVLALFRDANLNNTWKSTSADTCATWSALSDIVGQVPNLGRPRMWTVKELRGEAEWWTDTRLILSGFAYLNSLRYNAVWLSPDSGATWSQPFLLDSGADGGYGDMFYRPDTGQFVVISYSGTQDEAAIKQYTLTWPLA